MRKVLIIMVIIVFILVLGYAVVNLISSPLSQEQGTRAIESSLRKFVSKYDEVDNVVLRLYSESSGYDESFSVGNRDNGKPIVADSLFHIASIGKTMTATVFYMLEEEGILSIQDPIDSYISEDILKGLFEYEGQDYSSVVTIENLLTHTSGVSCYYDGPVTEGLEMQELMVEYPDRYWSPEELIGFSREKQWSVGKPGDIFYYSDTGYMLLMLILEEVEQMPYHQVFQEKLFNPLNMGDSYVINESNILNSNAEDILGLKLNGVDISKKNALSVGSSDGGIVSSTKDLLTFYKSLNNGKLITIQSYNQMKRFDKLYSKGISYGTGMMAFNLEELAAILPGLPTIYGGVGASGSFMLYDETNDLYIVLNVGVFDMMEESVTEIMKIFMIYNRIE